MSGPLFRIQPRQFGYRFVSDKEWMARK